MRRAILVGVTILLFLGCPLPFQYTPEGYSNTSASADPSTPAISASPVIAYSSSSGTGTVTGTESVETFGDTMITLASETVGAVIYYTTDGTTPDPHSGSTTSKYSASSPIKLAISNPTATNSTVTFTVTAIAIGPNMKPSLMTKATVKVCYSTAPSGYTVSFDQAYIGPGTQTAVSFTMAGASTAQGTTYSYSVTSSGGGTAVTGTGSVTSASQHVSGINVNGLADGTLTLSVTLKDAAGNTGEAATDTVVKDTVAPAGYTVSFYELHVNLSNYGAVRFQINGAEVGTTYSATISSGGTTLGPITGTVTSSTQVVSGINAASFPDGVLTLSVHLTDAAGNAGVAATHTCVKDTVSPVIFGWTMYWTGWTFTIDLSETVYGDSSGAGPLVPSCLSVVDVNQGESASMSAVSQNGTSLTFSFSWSIAPVYGDTIVFSLQNNSLFDAAGNAMAGGEITTLTY